MKVPETPANEPARLSELLELAILDTKPEPAFDALATLAAEITGAPIALVSLSGQGRQWFKARHGLDATEVPRELSFCGHVVAAGELLVVRDALADARFADNPLVLGPPHVRFYAGAPLRTAEGLVLGALCAMDREPRDLGARQAELLRLLAGQVVELLVSRRRGAQLAAERAIVLEREQRIRTLLDGMAEGVVLQNANGAIESTNPAAERILGLTADQMSGRTSIDPRWRAIHEDGSPFPGDTHPAMVTLRTGEPSSGVIMGVQKPSGELTWISVNARPLRLSDDEAPHSVVSTFHDITAQRVAQEAAERLARNEHLITVGTLAAGVGHEINNPLTFILTNLELAMEELRTLGGSSSSRLRYVADMLGDAREGVERIRRIVRGLRAFARERSEPVPTDVANSIEVSIQLAMHELRHRAKVSTELAETPPALADEARLSQILVNLLVNAAQAFPSPDPDRNRIVVGTSVGADGRIVITVRDNGPGIAPELQRRIFDPFFTTKPVGQGTGLGLSISQSIAISLGGELSVESTVGEGATFRLALPVAPVPKEGSRRPTAEGARARILVIDDDEPVLAAIARILEPSSDVVATKDAREAWRLLEAGEEFDVIFCDLMMPHISGPELWERVRARSAALADRFVFVTGGATSDQGLAFLEKVPNERIEKPFGVQTLRTLVQRILRARRPT
jgi:PAS domain S-box-containing protein